MLRSPQRNEPGGRREPRRTALVVRPTENGGRCANTGSGAICLPSNSEQFRVIPGNSGQASSDWAARKPRNAAQCRANVRREAVTGRRERRSGLAGATKNKLRRRRMGVISPLRFFLRFFLREGQDARLAVLMLCRPGRLNKTEGLQYLAPKGNVLPGSPGERLSLRRQKRKRLWRFRSSTTDAKLPTLTHGPCQIR